MLFAGESNGTVVAVPNGEPSTNPLKTGRGAAGGMEPCGKRGRPCNPGGMAEQAAAGCVGKKKGGGERQ